MPHRPSSGARPGPREAPAPRRSSLMAAPLYISSGMGLMMPDPSCANLEGDAIREMLPHESSLSGTKGNGGEPCHLACGGMSVTTLEALANAAVLIASSRQAAHSKGCKEEEKLWRYLRSLSNFVQVTGQVYQFEDFLKAASPSEHPRMSERLGSHKGTHAQRAMELLLKTLDKTAGHEQKQRVLLLIALLNFIADTGQLDEVEDFFSNRLEYAPVAIAHFTNHKEAEAWLRGIAEPPSPAYILIGDEYHQFWYRREDKTSGMYRDYPIESELEASTARGIPPQTPLFVTRAKAEEWLMNHPANPYAFVSIAGEHYFAVYHRRLKRHSLHHVASTLKAWEEYKRAVEREAALEAGQSDGPTE